MSKSQNQNELDAMTLIRKAYKKDTVEIEFEITKEVKATISLANAIDMFNEQKKLYREKLDKYEFLGYSKKPIDEKRWEEYIKNNPADKEKPANLAEQCAGEDTRNIILREILPAFLNSPEGDLIFPTPEKQKAFGDYIISTPSLANLISEKLLALTERTKGMLAQAKNSSGQEN